MSPLAGGNIGFVRLDAILGLLFVFFAMLFTLLYGMVMITMRPRFYYDHRGKLRYAYGEKPPMYPRLWN
jgi:hypothetical protein